MSGAAATPGALHVRAEAARLLVEALADVPTDDAGFLAALVSTRGLLLTEVNLAEVRWVAQGSKPTYSIDGRSVQWDSWLQVRLAAIEQLTGMIASLDPPWEVAVHAWT